MKISPTDPLFFSITSYGLAVDATCTLRRVEPKLLRFYVPKEPYEQFHIVGLIDSSESWV